jgi:hypothetical protein
MKRFWQCLAVILLLAPLTINAETISWLLPTTYTDNTVISATDKARLTFYLRGWKAGTPNAKTYFGEVRNGGASWGVAGDNTYVMNQMNQWALTNSTPGWIALKPGDNVLVTVSAALTYVDNGVTKEADGPESPSYAWTIYKAPPLPPPPIVVPSCNPPTGISIKP